MNNWIDNPATKYQLQLLGKNEKTILRNLKVGEYEFIFHRSNFDKVAYPSIGLPVKNKKFTVPKDPVIQIETENRKEQLLLIPAHQITLEPKKKNDGIQLSEHIFCIPTKI